MRILLTHRYFWPDTPPYAGMLRSIGAGLVEAGHDVHVYASRPSYREIAEAPRRETVEGMQVRRGWAFRERGSGRALRAMNLMIYCLGLFAHVLKTRPEVVTAASFPPVLAARTASIAARLSGARFVYHVQDVHPEVSKFSGGALGRGPVFHLLRWLDNQTLRASSAIVVLSEDMAQTLRARGHHDLPIHVINNFLLQSFDAETSPPEALRKPAGMRRLVFAGNLGRFQNLPQLVEGVVRSLDANPDLELLLMGDGICLPDLKSRWGEHPRVRFSPFLPFSQARGVIAEADIGLVSLSPDIYRVSYPSKLLTYMGLDLPVVALVERESALASFVESARVGAVPEDLTPDAIAEAIGRALRIRHQSTRLDPAIAVSAAPAHAVGRWKRMLEQFQPSP